MRGDNRLRDRYNKIGRAFNPMSPTNNLTEERGGKKGQGRTDLRQSTQKGHLETTAQGV